MSDDTRERRDPGGEPEEERLQASPGYAVRQLERALASASSQQDAAARERAARRAERWRAVLEGMLDGRLAVGSRVPVQGAPAWATLEVEHGGFATGNLLAGGELQPHEEQLRARLGEAAAGSSARAALNLYHLGDDGRAELLEMLRSGCYRILLPEEGALLVLAWLVARGEVERTDELVDAIAPFFDRLRFYPVPDARPLLSSSLVKLQTVGETIAQLEQARQQVQVERMNEATCIWAPLADRAVALFLETVEGPPPSLQTGPDGALVRRPDGHPVVQGGWPCRRYPEGWSQAARQLLDDYRAERARHGLCGKPDRPKENFARLRGYLERCVVDPAALTGRDVGMIRLVLASFITRHGAPGSERLARLREEQRRQGSRPTHRALAGAVLARLRARSPAGGLASVEEVTGPVSADESRRLELPAGAPIPAHLAVKVARCLEATLDELVAREVVGSGEVLARLLPQLTSQLRAAGFADPDLRRLYAAIYSAFRRRRSLLLLDLEHQVRLEELPWIAAIEPLRRPDDRSARAAAREALEQLVALALSGFPQTILPNKLLKELSSLAESAGLDVPLVEEVASDIFMGTFSEKFLLAAQRTARVLDGTLFARYYDLPVARVLAIDDVKRSRYAAPTSAAFAALCAERAGPRPAGRRSVAHNGKIIEQEQILTSHNLAVLWAELGLARKLSGRLPELARRCLHWLCWRQRLGIREWKAQLQNVKNCAFAWRQMVFFLSFAPGEQRAFLLAAEELLARQPEELRLRIAPALRGLELIVGGGAFDSSGQGPGGARRLLGWSTERHWLLRPRAEA